MLTIKKQVINGATRWIDQNGDEIHIQIASDTTVISRCENVVIRVYSQPLRNLLDEGCLPCYEIHSKDGRRIDDVYLLTWTDVGSILPIANPTKVDEFKLDPTSDAGRYFSATFKVPNRPRAEQTLYIRHAK